LTVSVAGLVVLAAATVAGLVVSRAIPGLGLFALSFVGLAGVIVAVGQGRSRPVRWSLSGDSTAAAVIGVTGCIVAIGYMVKIEPSVADALAGPPGIMLAAVLAGCLGVALAASRRSGFDRLARRFGVGASLPLGVGLLVDTRADASGVGDYVIFAPVAILLVVSITAAAIRRSFWIGLQAMLWTALNSGLFLFAIWLVEGVHRHRIDGVLLLDGHGASVGGNLNDALFWVLGFLPLWAVPFGVFGAALGSARWRRQPAD
jgi:hypothetical protein